MPYTPQTWSDLPSQTTPITAARLSHMETQYDQVAADIDDPATPVGAAVAASPVSTATQAALDLKQDESAMDASVAAQVSGGPLTGAALDASVNTTIETGLTGAAAQAIADTPEISATIDGRVPRPGNGIVFLGDSLTQWQDAATPANTATSSVAHSQRMSLGNLGSILSGQRALYLNNAGIGGNTSAQMLARFDTDVTPYAPAVVHVLAGTNDIAGSITLETFMANIAAIVAKIRNIGALPLLGLIPPKSAGMATVSLWNIALRRYATAQGIAVIDYYTPLVDTTTGALQSGYNGDGTHPNDAGFTVLAQTFATVVAGILSPSTVPLPQSNAYANNLLGNGLFPGTGAPWTGSVQSTEVGGGAPVLGQWMSVSSTGSAATVYQNVATVPVAGHRYALLGRIRTTVTSGTGGFHVRNRITLTAGSVDMMPLNNVNAVIPDGVFYTEYTCPADAVSQQVLFQINAGVTGTLKVAQIALYDLTALGLA